MMMGCMRRHHDVQEGVRALLVDRDNNPSWEPAALEAVNDASIQEYFAALGEHELVLGK